MNRRTFMQATTALLAVVGLPGWAIEKLYDQNQLTGLAQQLFMPLIGAPADEATSAVVHLLNRISYGPTPDEVARAQQLGLPAYIEEQLAPAEIDDRNLTPRLAALTTLQMSNAELLEQKAPLVIRELEQATVLRALYSRRQLQEVLVDFWSNHFNVYIGKGQCRFLKTTDDRDAIRPHVLGRFRDLLGASAKSPAMLFFLDNHLNREQAPNENYGRELMELHTLGVDGGYTEADVQAVARAFTGWLIRQGEFFFAPRQHDTTEKQVLGVTMPAGRGLEDGEQVLDLLAQNSATAHFIASKLCRRFVADVPPDALIQQVATVFQTTDGDLRQVIGAILNAPEFAAAANQKFRRPAEFAIAAARALGVETDGKQLAQQIRQLGQPFFGEPAPNGYPDVAPAWLSTSGLLGRWNYGLGLAAGKLPNLQVNYLPDLAGADTATSLANKLVAALLPGRTESNLAAYLAEFLGGDQASAQQLNQRANVAAGLLLAAPIFQWH
ncbi:DUF1800 domain-containing protein [soil metagenome]